MVQKAVSDLGRVNYIFCFLSVVLNTPLYILYSTLGKVPSAAQS